MNYSVFLLFWDKKALWRSSVEFYLAKFFSRNAHICVFRVKISLLNVDFLLPKHVMSSMILKHFCKRDQIKFLSYFQEFEYFTKYIVLLFSFEHKTSGACSVYVVLLWQQVEAFLRTQMLALLSAFSLSFVPLVFLLLSFISSHNSLEAE